MSESRSKALICDGICLWHERKSLHRTNGRIRERYTRLGEPLTDQRIQAKELLENAVTLPKFISVTFVIGERTEGIDPKRVLLL